MSKLAMKSNQVEPVQRAIRNYFKNTHYKVKVESVDVIGDRYAIASNPEWVRDEVMAQVVKQSKFDVVDRAEGPRAPAGDGVCREEFPANSDLRIKLQGFESGERRLSLELLKDGCIKGKSTRTYRGGKEGEDRASLGMAIELGVRELLGQVVKIRVAQLVKDDDWFKGAEMVTVKFAPDPEGSVVMVDNNMVCEKTPCENQLSKGEHTVMVSKKEYTTRSESLDIQADTTIDWKLRSVFGWLTVLPEIKGVSVVIDGKPAVAAPVEKLQMNAGKHKVEAQADCYLPVSTQLNVLAGEEAKWTPEMTLAEGGVDVSVADTDGKKVKGDLWIDGQKIGPVPGKYKAGVCAKEMVVKTSWDATYSAPLAIKAKKIVSMKAVVDPEPVKEVAAEAPPPPPEEPSEKKDVGARHAVPETTPVSSSERSKYINAGHAAFWTGLAVAGIGGGISTWQMTVNKDKANNATTSSDLSMYTGKYNLCLGFSIAMYLIGAGAMITGIALWGIAPEIKTNAGVVSGLNLSPVIGPGSAGLSAGGQW